MEEGRTAFVCVAKVGDPSTARVLAAKLDSEGIESRLHGEAFGPYPVTVGQLAVTELWVPTDRVADANLVLLDSEVNVALSGVDFAEPGPWPLAVKFMALAVTAIFLAAVVWAAMRVS